MATFKSGSPECPPPLEEMEEATLRLEGFSESLRGKRIYFVAKDRKHGEQFLRGRLDARTHAL